MRTPAAEKKKLVSSKPKMRIALTRKSRHQKGKTTNLEEEKIKLGKGHHQLLGAAENWGIYESRPGGTRSSSFLRYQENADSKLKI